MAHTVTFHPETCDGIPGIMPHIDGRAFADIINEHEATAALPLRVDLRSDMRSGDGPLVSCLVNFFDCVPTVADRHPRTAEKVIALVCGCGEEGCGRTWVDVEVTTDKVVWSKVRTWITKYEPYPNFGPWAFDRSQYETECDRIATHLGKDRTASD